MADGILFDKACRGYNREQVNAFILKLNTSYQEQLAEQTECLEAQREELASEKARADTLLLEKTALEKELAELREDSELIKMEADELAASLRKLHAEYNALKEAFDTLQEKNTDEDGALEVSAGQADKLSVEAQDRFALVLAAKERILGKLTSDRIIISREELIKLCERLSADAADFYRAFTDGALL